MKGAYVLVLALSSESLIEAGKLGAIKFERGFYAYSGSALNGLERRIERHLRKEKKLWWHIDYLLCKAEILNVFCAESSQRIECEIAGNLAKNLIPIKKFGCSDCKCKSHLFYCESLAQLNDKVAESFKKNKNNPFIYGADKLFDHFK